MSPTEPLPDEDGSDEAPGAIIEDFEVFLLRPEEASEAQQDNPYIQKLSDDSCSSVAVPMGALALDEASCQTSARMHAKSYMPNKPIRYGIQFYASVSVREVYCHSIVLDNGSGNKLPLSPASMELT